MMQPEETGSRHMSVHLASRQQFNLMHAGGSHIILQPGLGGRKAQPCRLDPLDWTVIVHLQWLQGWAGNLAAQLRQAIGAASAIDAGFRKPAMKTLSMRCFSRQIRGDGPSCQFPHRAQAAS